jgi:L,D-transpeptidase catalytic domain
MRRTHERGFAEIRRRGARVHGVALVAMVLLVAIAANGQGVVGLARQSGDRRVVSRRRIVVSIPDRKLALVENGRVVRIFRVAVGAPESPSPTGEFRIVQRLVRPTYYAPGVIIPAGPQNPLGPRWIGLNLKSYGIHGTNQPRSIGRSESHGCIRMRNRDVAQLFEMVRVGDVVELHAGRDEFVVQLFGTGNPAVTTASLGFAETLPADATESSGREGR